VIHNMLYRIKGFLDSGNINRTQSMAMNLFLKELIQIVVSGAKILYWGVQKLKLEQFWQTASASTLKNGDMEITVIIDGKVKVVSEASIRRHLKLEDSDEKAATMPHDSPLLRVHSLRSDEGSMTLNELMVLCTTLSKKVETLESDLKRTKLTYGDAYTKLIMKVKKLEHKVKSRKARRRVRLVIYDDEDNKEDHSKHGRKIAQIEEDEGITLPDISTANVPISTASVEVSTASPEVKTAAESLVYIRRSAAKRKDKGKAIMKEAEPVQKNTKLQLEQERLGLEEALRLQEQLNEEERQRIAKVHEEASTFNAKEWDNIQAQIKADEELAHRKRKFAQQKAEQRRNKPINQAQQRTYMCNYIMYMGSHTIQQLKKLSFDEIKELFETTMNRVNTFTPMESDDTVPKVVAGSSKRDAEQELNQEIPEEGMNVEALQTKYPIIDWEVYTKDSRMDDLVELKRLFEPDDDDYLWKLQRYMHDPLKWRSYDTCVVHHVSTERGHDIFMLVEKNYPLTRALMTLMLSNKLQVDEYSVMAYELLRKIFILANRPRQYVKKGSTEDIGEDSAAPFDSHSTTIISQSSSSKPQKNKSRRKQRKDSGPTEPVTDEAHVSTPSYDPPQSGKDSMQLSKLMNLCTNLQEKVLDLEKAKTAQAKEIASLKKRVKQLEKRRKSRTLGLRRLRKVGSSSRVESSNDASLGAQEDASKQGRKIKDLDADAEVTLVDKTQEMNDDNLMFDTGVLEEQGIKFEKVVKEPVVSVATTTKSTTKSIPVSVVEVVTTVSASFEIPDELTLAQTLIEIKTAQPKPVTTAATIVTSVRPRSKGIIFHDQEEQVPTSTKTLSSLQSQLLQVKEKGKGKMVEPGVPLKKKDKVALDEEMARNIEA
ncbi:hypothetical protein Tco_0343544, partial [Tanacetum coccineum]